MLGTNFLVPITSTLNVAFDDKNGYAYFATCTGTPPSSGLPNQFVGFIHGCLMQQTDSGTGVSALWQNTGATGTSPVWERILADGSGSSQYGVISVPVSGTTVAVNVFGVTNGINGTVTGVYAVSGTTAATTVTLADSAGTVAALPLSTTVGGVTGSAFIVNSAFTSAGTMTLTSSTVAASVVTITFIYQ